MLLWLLLNHVHFTSVHYYLAHNHMWMRALITHSQFTYWICMKIKQNDRHNHPDQWFTWATYDPTATYRTLDDPTVRCANNKVKLRLSQWYGLPGQRRECIKLIQRGVFGPVYRHMVREWTRRRQLPSSAMFYVTRTSSVYCGQEQSHNHTKETRTRPWEGVSQFFFRRTHEIVRHIYKLNNVEVSSNEFAYEL